MATMPNIISILYLICLTGFVASQGVRSPPPVRCRGGFTVRKADQRSLTAGRKVGFQEVLTNIGGWSQSTNDFQAPCNGVYYFSFHAISPQNDDFTLALMKGGIYQVTAYGSRNDYQQGSNSVLLILNAGEKVHLELQGGTIYEHPFNEAYTSFSGFLVEAI
ncbi:complement C1q-like protein 4 [Macrobrachium nipponense]|uniref:complement C1q-like protein 4 n=1 Tax=Macrobrachium nipponense TaxID=159736 RepID=UPI0030C7ED3F